ncbi:MAG: serine/threonine protein kinase [Actinomycetota bacterium]|nr:serine/threonine protein kinase [Actinomycetota bacterium]
MADEQLPGRHWFCLPPGTRVEDWCVVGCRGHGAYGIVYRAVRVGQEAAGEVALKVAMYPWDPRFMREVGLLSLVHHPSVPRLLGQGFWKHSSGVVYPFIVMEWIEGTPLYEWAREQAPSSRQVSQVLAQLARALQATHEANAVHRDVKGENVLVRRADGRAMLTDFGAGHYYGAARLTWQPQPPGTPAYQSPESGLFQLLSVHSRDAHYVAGPGDDVFALGVTAYRLVTGMYPPAPVPQRDEEGRWRMMPLYLPPPHELNPRVEPQLSALILRMLSLTREERGSAGELAEALEAAVGGAEPEVEAPAGVPVRERPRARGLSWRSERVLAGVGVCLALGLGLAVHVHWQGAASRERLAVGPGRTGEGPVGLGGSVSEAPVAPVQEPSEQEAIGQEPLPELRPGQLRPDARGQCPGRKQFAINGGCWLEVLASDAEECKQNGHVLIKGQCYAPAMETRRKPPPTSAPPQ